MSDDEQENPHDEDNDHFAWYLWEATHRPPIDRGKEDGQSSHGSQHAS